MGRYHERALPGESAAWRAARDDLLAAEMDLRRRIEALAAQRRALPLGGAVPEDYVFTEGAADPEDRATEHDTRLSELFAVGRESLVIYSFMYAPGGSPCPMCIALLDSLDGAARHAGDRINLAVVARAPPGELRDWARRRGWRHLRLLSSQHNRYNADYLAESDDGAQPSVINVFRRTLEGVIHTWHAELVHVPAEPGQHPRHADLVWPLWALFDLTPDGRGDDWMPRID